MGLPLPSVLVGNDVAIAAALVTGVMMAVTLLRPRRTTAAWRRGAEGEERVARVLDRLRKRGWSVEHDLAIPGTKANIDHLVDSPRGLFVVDTKNYRGRLHFDQGVLQRGHSSFAREVQSVRWQADFVRRTRAGCSPVHCIICVLGAELPCPRIVFGGVVVVAGTRSLMSEFDR